MCLCVCVCVCAAFRKNEKNGELEGTRDLRRHGVFPRERVTSNFTRKKKRVFLDKKREKVIDISFSFVSFFPILFKQTYTY